MPKVFVLLDGVVLKEVELTQGPHHPGPQTI
jgi:hypothetical protein